MKSLLVNLLTFVCVLGIWAKPLNAPRIVYTKPKRVSNF